MGLFFIGAWAGSLAPSAHQPIDQVFRFPRETYPHSASRFPVFDDLLNELRPEVLLLGIFLPQLQSQNRDEGVRVKRNRMERPASIAAADVSHGERTT
jgi:hypothetical protein